MIGADSELARTPTGPAFADAVTFAFGDGDAQLYGLARIGLSPGENGGARSGSALALLFAGREPLAAIARGGLEPGADAGWDAIELGGLRMTVDVPLRVWRVAMDAEDHGFDLRFEALTPPAEIAGDEAVARAGGMAGYEQLCGVTGTVRASGEVREIRCLGQRGHGWGEPDWSRIESARTLAAWPESGYGLTMASVRPNGTSHAGELVWAALIDERGTLRVENPRVSTTYDDEGRQRRAGLELWVDEDGFPRRAAGEVLCGTTLDLGALRLDCAFFRWRMEGREGVGRYVILR